MASKRTREAQENLRKKFKTGVGGNPGRRTVTVDTIDVGGPEFIEVGTPFRLTVQVTPPVDGWAYLTVKKGTPCGYKTRDLKKREIDLLADSDREIRCIRDAKVMYAVGLCPQCYGMAPLVGGAGAFEVTQYTRETFVLEINVGNKKTTWGLNVRSVYCVGEAPKRK